MSQRIPNKRSPLHTTLWWYSAFVNRALPIIIDEEPTKNGTLKGHYANDEDCEEMGNYSPNLPSTYIWSIRTDLFWDEECTNKVVWENERTSGQ